MRGIIEVLVKSKLSIFGGVSCSRGYSATAQLVMLLADTPPSCYARNAALTGIIYIMVRIARECWYWNAGCCGQVAHFISMAWPGGHWEAFVWQILLLWYWHLWGSGPTVLYTKPLFLMQEEAVCIVADLNGNIGLLIHYITSVHRCGCYMYYV